MLKTIVGVEIEVKDMQSQYKLSQNRSVAERKNISGQLKRRGSAKLVEAMEQDESQ